MVATALSLVLLIGIVVAVLVRLAKTNLTVQYYNEGTDFEYILIDQHEKT